LKPFGFEDIRVQSIEDPATAKRAVDHYDRENANSAIRLLSFKGLEKARSRKRRDDFGVGVALERHDQIAAALRRRAISIRLRIRVPSVRMSISLVGRPVKRIASHFWLWPRYLPPASSDAQQMLRQIIGDTSRG
jgi:hypothetical protein